MGRGFKGATSSTASSVKDGGGSTAGRATDDTSCGLCKQEVAVQEEEHIVGLCTCCGSVPYHIPCVQDHLERTLRCQIREGGYNTKAWEKVQQKIKQRPWTLFSQNGGAQKLKVQCPACQEGFVDSADVEKPVRKLPAPLPAPATRQRGQPAPTSGAKKPSAPAPAPRPMAKPKLTQQQQIQQQLAVARRELGSGKGAAPNHVSGQPRQGGASGGGVASVRARQHATGRPPWLQMCPEVVDGGECYMYSCEHCHSKAEQAEREQEWQEEQAAKRREEQQQELEEHKRQLEADAAATAAAAGGPRRGVASTRLSCGGTSWPARRPPCRCQTTP